MIKDYLLPLLICLLLLSAPVLAQDVSPGFRPGTWYVGLQHQPSPVFGGFQPGLQVGRLLTPRLAWQSGLSLGRYRPHWPSWWPQDNLHYPFTGTMYLTHTSYNAYVPFHFRYLFSQPHRRVQVYGLIGIHASFHTTRMTPLAYQDGQLVDRLAEGRWNSADVGYGFGPGLRVRTVDRLFLFAEIPFSWNVRIWRGIRNPSFTGHRLIGLQYEFR